MARRAQPQTAEASEETRAMRATGEAAGDRSPAPGLSRRSVLGGTTALAGTALLGGSGFVGRARAQAATEIVFSFAPDESGSLANLIEAFNADHEGRIRVRWREMPRETDAYRRALESEFLVESSEIDVIGGDVIWTAPFAHKGWIRDLTGRFRENYATGDYLGAAIDSIGYRNRVWAVPWFSDVGMLYYRRDLLEAHGHDSPPASWPALAEVARGIMDEEGVAHGLVFQGAAYEGGVTNALEYVWSAGGRVMTGSLGTSSAFGMARVDPNVVTVKSRAAAAGLDTAGGLVADGIAPPEVAGFAEQQALERFMAGDAVFMRNWPFAYGVIASGQGAIGVDQVGIAPIPVTPPGQRSFACLGGWNLMINAFSEKTEAAWTFIRYATEAAAQKQRALEGGFLPTLRRLYEDEELRAAMPVIPLAEAVFPTARARPISPFYPDVSARIAIAFNRVLTGELTGDEAVRRLDRELRLIIRKSS